MARIFHAGALYFALVFLAGFVLGAVRTVWLAPRLGELAAVALELPLILAASWVAAGWVVKRLGVPARGGPRLAMGSVAFVLLLAAEAGLGAALGRGAAAYFASLATPPGLLGLAGQIAYALFPWLRLQGKQAPEM